MSPTPQARPVDWLAGTLLVGILAGCGSETVEGRGLDEWVLIAAEATIREDHPDPNVVLAVRTDPDVILARQIVPQHTAAAMPHILELWRHEGLIAIPYKTAHAADQLSEALSDFDDADVVSHIMFRLARMDRPGAAVAEAIAAKLRDERRRIRMHAVDAMLVMAQSDATTLGAAAEHLVPLVDDGDDEISGDALYALSLVEPPVEDLAEEVIGYVESGGQLLVEAAVTLARAGTEEARDALPVLLAARGRLTTGWGGMGGRNAHPQLPEYDDALRSLGWKE